MVGTHFCGGEAVLSELAIGKAHLDCGMEEMQSCESGSESDELKEKPCCENQYLSLDLDEQFNKLKDLSIDQLKLVFVAAIQFFDWTFFFPASEKPIFSIYDPPPLERDFSVLFQTFLL